MTQFHQNKGFTLIELLVAMGLLGIFLSMLAAAMNQSNKYTRNVTTRSEITDEVRVAGQMIADQINSAVYVYPPGSFITLGVAGSDPWTLTTSEATPSQNWVVGDARTPIVAFIQAPTANGTGPQAYNSVTGASTCPVSPDSCLTFVAYYLIKRTQATTANSNLYGPADTRNPDAYMIFEYRKTLPFGRLGDAVADKDLIALAGSGIQSPDYIIKDTSLLLKQASGKLVADYVSFTGFALGSTVCRSRVGQFLGTDGKAVKFVNTNSTIDADQAKLFGCGDFKYKPTDSDSGVASLVRGLLTLQGSYIDRGGTTVQSAPLSFSVNPRNLYTPAFAVN